jgi:N-acetyl-anhydromuramyl-L-alanine amidase AmpD
VRVTGVSYVQGRNSYVDADGTKYGIAIHNTSNTASAAAEASYATRRTDGVSAHFYVDDTTVIQSLDTLARAGHAGSSQGNQNAVAVEIRGLNNWTRQQWLDGVAWDLLGSALAQVCHAYGVQVRRAYVAEMQSNPKVHAFYSHDDMRRAWGGTDHTDPGPGFPWDRLFSAVNAALGGKDDDVEQTEKIQGYRAADRTVGDGLADLTNLRDWLYGVPGAKAGDGGNPPPAGSRADLLIKGAQAAATAKPADPAALAAALAPLLTEHLGVEVGADQLVAALSSEAGQAALVKAANTAEDS